MERLLDALRADHRDRLGAVVPPATRSSRWPRSAPTSRAGSPGSPRSPPTVPPRLSRRSAGRWSRRSRSGGQVPRAAFMSNGATGGCRCRPTRACTRRHGPRRAGRALRLARLEHHRQDPRHPGGIVAIEEAPTAGSASTYRLVHVPQAVRPARRSSAASTAAGPRKGDAVEGPSSRSWSGGSTTG